jgi:hypothetical protein
MKGRGSNFWHQVLGAIKDAASPRYVRSGRDAPPADRVSVVYNWVDENLVPQPRYRELARGLGIDGQFVLWGAGNLGAAQPPGSQRAQEHGPKGARVAVQPRWAA